MRLYAARSSCRLKSPVALSGKKFLSTKVARGARRVKEIGTVVKDMATFSVQDEQETMGHWNNRYSNTKILTMYDSFVVQKMFFNIWW